MNKRAIAGGAVIVAIDQAVKAIVRHDIPEGSARQLIPSVDLVRTKNSGVSFGFLNTVPAWVVVIVSTFALAAVVTLIVKTLPGRAGRIAAMLIVAGAIGNLIDRVAAGSVTDFLDLPALPPCNIADISITFGAITMIGGLLFWEFGERRQAAQAESGSGADADPSA